LGGAGKPKRSLESLHRQHQTKKTHEYVWWPVTEPWMEWRCLKAFTRGRQTEALKSAFEKKIGDAVLEEGVTEKFHISNPK